MIGRLMRPGTWSLLLVGSVGLGIWVGYATHRGSPRDPRLAGLMLATACGGVIVLLWIAQAAQRSRARREWRETAGRARNQRKPATAIIIRDEDFSGLREEMTSLRDEIADVRATADAAADIVARACRLEGTPVPAALQAAAATVPLPPVRLACRDGRRVG